MRRAVLALSAAVLACAVRAAEDGGGAKDASVPGSSLAQRAAEKLKAGDRPGACADAKSALGENPDDDNAYKLAELTCEGADLPNKAKYTPKVKLKRFSDGPEGAMAGQAPPPASGAVPPSPGGPGGGGGGGAAPSKTPAAEPKWYEGGPKLEAGVVVPEAPAKVDGMLEISAEMTAAAGTKLEAGDAREAIRLATEALETNPNNPRALLVRGAALRLKKQCRAALADAEKGLSLRANDLLLLKLKAEALNCSKDYKAALETADAVLTIDPTDARATALKAWALKGMGDADGMMTELKKAAALNTSYESSIASLSLVKDDPEVFFLYPGDGLPPKKGAKKTGPGLSRTARLAIAGGFALVTLAGMMTGLAQWARSRKAVLPAQAPPEAPVPASPAPASPGASSAPETGKSPPHIAFAPPPPDDGRLKSGAKVVSRYEVADFLGEGATGSVYSGFDQKVSRVVAVRRMDPAFSKDPDELRKFLEAAGGLALPNHPGIVCLFDAVEHEGSAFLVTDFVDGRTLSRMLASAKRLSFVDALAVASQVCQALDCAHRANVVHADLKPGNIMVDKRGGVRITDFFLSRRAKEALSRLGGKESPGEKDYLAPEQVRGPAVPASDVYAFGLVLYEMLTGLRPFRSSSEKSVGTFPPCQSVVPELPKGLDTVFAAVLRPGSEQRLADSMELLKKLQALG